MKRWIVHEGKATYEITEDTCPVCGEFSRVKRLVRRDDGCPVADDLARYEVGTDCGH